MRHHTTFAADHQAVAALEAGNATTGSDVEVVNSSGLQLRATAHVIAVMRIAAIDDDVACVKPWHEIAKRLINNGRRHHQPDGVRLGKP